MANKKTFETQLKEYRAQLAKIKKIEDSLAGNYEFLHLNLTNFFTGDTRYGIGVKGTLNNSLIRFKDISIDLLGDGVVIKNVDTDLGPADFKIVSVEFIDEAKIKSMLERIMEIKFISEIEFKKLGVEKIDNQIKELTNQKNKMINKLKESKSKFI